MIGRAAIRLGAVVAVVLIVVALAAEIRNGGPNAPTYFLFGVVIATFVGVGWLISERRSANAVGPLLLWLGVLFAAYLPVDVYLRSGDDLPGGVFLAMFIGMVDAPSLIVLAFTLMVFPSGRLPSRRWRPAIVLGSLGILSDVIGVALGPDPILLFPAYRSPFAIDGFPGDALVGIAYGVMGVVLMLAAGSLIVRWRTGTLTERAQIKWVVAASLVLVLAEGFNVATFRADDPNSIPALIATIAFALVPLGIGVAIFRYRLYDIDRVISRGIAYGLVSGILVATFGATVLALQAILAPFTQGQTVAVAASTLAVFALSSPVLHRIRGRVDRRFDRARYDAERTASAFADRLRDEVDMATVTADLTSTTTAALAPASFGIWIRQS